MADADTKKMNVDDTSDDSPPVDARVKKANDYRECQFGDTNVAEEKTEKSEVMTVKEVASYLKISHYSVYNLVKRGELPAMRILNKLRFDSRKVERFLKEQELE